MARRKRNVNADLTAARFWVMAEGFDLFIEEGATRPSASIGSGGERRVVMGGKRTKSEADDLLKYLAQGAGYRVRGSK